jgi:hypothetical protein
MKVFNLRCVDDHRFEGWFGSEDDYVSQNERGLVECPVCGERDVTRLPSAPRLNLSSGGSATTAERPTQEVTQAATLQQAWMQAVRRIVAETEDVGERFPEEARRIHYGEVPERAIRGRASRDETAALHDEGIEVMPLPPLLKEPLQ